MHRQRATIIAAALAAVIGLSGCTHHAAPTLPLDEPETTSASATEPPAGALPAPEALTDVLYRLADPGVPGADKLTLIEGTQPADAATIDRFSTALRDGGYLPMTFGATDVTWSSRYPGNATADVSITTNKPEGSEFTFPMEFKPYQGGWQLSRQTAETLLAFGKAHAPATPTP
ncbi:hypothetical protein KIH27_05440 [Mycobacterium sp. M1]|uniref:Low molecular weight antigen MTB12-like C-terminal domain-containing protein n=1 Tax=Mycolicibacter acidiphilus TaxID=2835306 RepID=A0ABS5RHU9_9MYCO|nr:hypothetical protein [Mycolicibacter acidiphilus]MBS9533031.1 hypothetical protein [Mycolicibacter acidiphilus]